MTAELTGIISIMSNVIIISINEYDKYKTAPRTGEFEHRPIVEHPKQQHTVKDFQNFLRTAGRVTAIVEERIETDISEIFDPDSATFVMLVHLEEHERTTFLDFRSSFRINLSYPDADGTYLDDLINDVSKQPSELDKGLKSHKNRYYSLLNSCVEIAYDYVNI